MSQADAYLSIRSEDSKKLRPHTATNMGSKYMRHIKKKIDWEEMLNLHSLDDDRLAQEVELRLKSTTKKFFPDEGTETIDDNGTRMQATKLLAELRGKTSSGINITQNNNTQINVILTVEEEAQFEANIASMFDD